MALLNAANLHEFAEKRNELLLPASDTECSSDGFFRGHASLQRLEARLSGRSTPASSNSFASQLGLQPNQTFTDVRPMQATGCDLIKLTEDASWLPGLDDLSWLEGCPPSFDSSSLAPFDVSIMAPGWCSAERGPVTRLDVDRLHTVKRGGGRPRKECSSLSSSELGVAKQRRGPKPKYVFPNPDEAAKARKARNRKAALDSYYKKKGRVSELQAEISRLKIENFALEALSNEIENSGVSPLGVASDAGVDAWLAQNA